MRLTYKNYESQHWAHLPKCRYYRTVILNWYFRSDDIALKSLLKREVPEDMSSIGPDDFVYGVCRNTSCYYNPYDLKIVKKAAIPSDAIFYTITHDNVMMVRSFTPSSTVI